MLHVANVTNVVDIRRIARLIPRELITTDLILIIV